jgi:hypothetical protein
MLLNLKKIYGHKLAAVDGQLGNINDFYFDDKSWAVRYLVVDTGTWLPGRQVLLAPHALGKFDADRGVVTVHLTCQQVEHSPSIEAHRPVSRQYEENYYSYYGWPNYWQGGGVWGLTEYPVVVPISTTQEPVLHAYPKWEDVHLRSSRHVTGYQIEATDGPIGTVSGFLVDDKTWTIRELVVETGHWYAGKEIMIAPSKVTRVSYEEAKVYVQLTQADIRKTEENEVVRAGEGTASY